LQQKYEYHTPVLRDECLSYLEVKKDGVYVDCTLGGGGHARAILEAGGRVIGLDQDPDAIARASVVCAEYLQSGRMEIFLTNFRSAAATVMSKSKFIDNLGGVDGVLMDLGISSHQIDEASRGFAFGQDGPLDMRMSKGGIGPDSISLPQGGSSLTAATICNEWDAERIANVLYDYGEETKSRQIAREIIAARPIATTGQLEQLISRITPWKHRPKTLARCFQALRIVVNDEMAALDEALENIHTCVRPGGRLVVISYHSLEDRRVKRLLKTGSVNGDGAAASILQGGGAAAASAMSLRTVESENTSDTNNPWKALFKRAQAPSEAEIESNRRARSAKLRVATRVDLQSGSSSINSNSDNGGAMKKKRFIGAKQQQKLLRQREAAEKEDMAT